ncbi:hypothetical protein BDV18DRAFT_160192 [Aspergillus unguis]
MRANFFLLLLVSLVPALLAFVIPVPHIDRPEYGILLGRQSTPSNETQEDTGHGNGNATSTDTDIKGNSTVSGGKSQNSTTTTVPTLNNSITNEEDASNATTSGELPLKPSITPALGVGGFILLVTGGVLALIGVRNLWVHVFLSSAFLTSLGVTVLIVYVMNPPVRAAIQGAYLVAIFFTGVTFGGLAIVFKELAEGLGCLLGGFCTSMWLLSTRPGGLIQDKDAKTGFIGAISLACYAVSFSHYTRPYGLIVSTSIAGGTVVALGIDCYSKAGLKEFWLYLWDLNDDIFPLGTDTYPVTRYIKVELAATVIVAVMGVISQLRLWKVVRERRAKDEEKRQEAQKEKDEAEAEVAKRMEEENMKERMEWEAKYGDGARASEASSTIPGLAAGSQAARSHTDEKNGGDLDAVEESVSESDVSYRCSDCRARGDDDVSTTSSKRRSQHQDPEAEHQKPTADTKSPEEALPKALRGRVTDDKASDVTAVVGSETVSVYSKRLSMLSRKTSVKTARKRASESREALIDHDDSSAVAVADDDADSDRHTSAADSQYQAMLDEEQPATATALDEKNTTTPMAEMPENGSMGKAYEGKSDTATETPQTVDDKLQKPDETVSESKTNPDPLESIPAETTQHESEAQIPEKAQPKLEDAKKPDSEKEMKREIVQEADPEDTDVTRSAKDTKSEKPCDGDKLEDDRIIAGKSDKGKIREDRPVEGDSNPELLNLQKGDPQEDTQKADTPLSEKSPTKQESKKEEPKRLDAKTVQQIPKHTSRVVQAYRMNEWAKHLSTAEIPDPEPIYPLEDEPDAISEEKEEAAAPVNVTELLQTPLNAQPPPAVESRNSIERNTSTNEHGRSQKKRRSGSPRRLSGQSVGSHFSQGLPPAVQPQPSNMNLATSTTNLVEQSQESEKTKPRWKGPAPLIAVREDMVRSRLSSVSLPTDAHTRHSTGQSPTDFTRYPSAIAIPEEDDDDIPLSQRRSMLHLHQRGASPSPINTPPAPNPTPNPAPAAPSRWNNPGVPSRANSPAVLAAWRESVREDLEERRDPLKFAHSAGPMPTGSGVGVDRSASPSPFGQLGQRNASSMSLGDRIGDRIAEGMQRGDMSDLHREALRRMQAKANQSVNRSHRAIGQSAVDVELRPLSVRSQSAPFPPPPTNQRRPFSSPYQPVSRSRRPHHHLFTFTTASSPSLAIRLPSPKTAPSQPFRDLPIIPPPQVKEPAPAHRPRVSSQSQSSPTTTLPPFERLETETETATSTSSRSRSSRLQKPWVAPRILRPPAVRLANPINHVPRITPVTAPRILQESTESLPLESHRDAYPLLTIPERRRSRLTPSPNSLIVERSQQESESGRSSIAVPRASGQRERDASEDEFKDVPLDMDTNVNVNALGTERPRHVPSHQSLRSQAAIASIPSNPGQPQEPEVAEELAWGPAHPCFPHINPHVPPGSDEYMSTRIIRIRRDWMVKGDLAPTYSNLYPEILDPLLPEHEFRRVIATVNDELISAFNPYSIRNWIDGAIGLITGWIWEDLGAPGVKSHLRRVEDWLERWNREVGAKDGVRIWSLRRTAYMSLDIQIPDPKVGIVPSDANTSRPGTRPESGGV